MLIDLSDIILHERKDVLCKADIEMQKFSCKNNEYYFAKKNPVRFIFSMDGKSRLFINAEINISLNIPCDRCLDDVENEIIINTFKEIDMNESEEQDFINEKSFDVEKFIYNEILIELPMKVLCSNNCKGICDRCGVNLNQKSCDCDTTELDPRMAKVLDLFKEYKEV